MLPYITLSEYQQEALNSWYPNFDKSLVKAYVYLECWSNYDCSGFLMVFLGIDDTYQYVQDETNPFSSCESELKSSEISEEFANYLITTFNLSIQHVQNDDSNYGI